MRWPPRMTAGSWSLLVGGAGGERGGGLGCGCKVWGLGQGGEREGVEGGGGGGGDEGGGAAGGEGGGWGVGGGWRWAILRSCSVAVGSGGLLNVWTIDTTAMQQTFTADGRVASSGASRWVGCGGGRRRQGGGRGGRVRRATGRQQAPPPLTSPCPPGIAGGVSWWPTPRWCSSSASSSPMHRWAGGVPVIWGRGNQQGGLAGG